MKVYIFILGLCLLTLDSFATTYYSQGTGNFYADAIWATTESGVGQKYTDFSINTTDDFVIQNSHTVYLPALSITIGSITVESGGQLLSLASGTSGQATLTFTDFIILGEVGIFNDFVYVTVENIYLIGTSELNFTASDAQVTHTGFFYRDSDSDLTTLASSLVITGLLDDYIDGTITGDNQLHIPSSSNEGTLAHLPTEFLSETGSVTLKKDYVLKISSAIPSTFTINPGSSGTASDNGSVEFLAGSSGTFTAANTNPFYNVTMNTSSGITLGAQMTMGGNLTLTDGIITTGGNVLSLISGATIQGASYTSDVNTTVSGGSNSSHIDGSMSLAVASTSNYVLLPIGDASMLRVGGVRRTVASANGYTLTARYNQSAHSDRDDVNDGSLIVSKIEYWDIAVTGTADVDGSTENFNSVVTYHTNSGVDASKTNSINLMHYRADGKWYSEGDVAGDATHTNDTNDHNDNVEAFLEAPTASFSPFTIGGESADHDLPITLKYFRVDKDGDDLEVTWATAQEINNDYFEIEASNNKINIDVLATLDGAGNSQTELTYDHQLEKGDWENYQYFRLKQTDFDGQFSYSDWVQIEMQELQNEEFNYVIYPNPSSIEINVAATSLSNETINTYQIFDLNGKRYHETEWNPTQHTINISSLPKGIYMLMISTVSGKKKIQRFSVQ